MRRHDWGPTSDNLKRYAQCRICGLAIRFDVSIGYNGAVRMPFPNPVLRAL